MNLQMKNPGREPAWLSISLSVMKRHRPGKEQWHYEHGLILQALDRVGEQTGRPEFAAFVQEYLEVLVAPDGAIQGYRNDELNLDQINPGKVVFDLLKRTGDQRWRIALGTLRGQLDRQPRTPSGGFWHKKIYPQQMWLDGLYMQAPFLARYAAEIGPAEDFAEVVRQLVLMERMARDPATGLLYHAWDESKQQLWANPASGCSPHFWSRAMGWYAMALVDVLDWLPATQSGRDELLEILARLARAIKAVQDPDSGLWYQVLDQGERQGNYLESSGSAMFTYAIAKALRRGWLSDGPGGFRTMVEAAWEGLLKKPFRQDDEGEWHLDGICSVAGLGGTPYRDGSYQYYVSEPVRSDDYKGVGPFILAGLELESLP